MMECTQRLECTQDLNGTHNQTNRQCPEQIGYLGMCGKEYPVVKGPNKIGRDPHTCHVVLHLSSISRQHAVLNIINHKDFMLMDLGSANKTKLSGNPLQPYIPQAIKDGDTLQFGDVFGVFRLLEDEHDLPLTQAINIPDTPVPVKHRVNTVTTIPESPDVSDRDESFIVPSQPKGPLLKAKTHHYIKPGKTISIQPMGNNVIDNVYWNSSKKSTSFDLDDFDKSIDDPSMKLKEKENLNGNDIHELETQEFFSAQKKSNDLDSIHAADTQPPQSVNGAAIHSVDSQIPKAVGSPSIYSLATQMPKCEAAGSPSIHNVATQMPYATSSPTIHSLNTQMPGAIDSPSNLHNLDTQLPANLSVVCEQNNMEDNIQFDISLSNKEKEEIATSSKSSPIKSSDSKVDLSNEEILFEDIDDECYTDVAESQAILSEDINLSVNRLVESESDVLSQIIKPKSAKRNQRIKSDSSTDCEEDIVIVPTQRTPEKCVAEDEATDCEDEVIELIPSEKVYVPSTSKSIVNFEDLATQVIHCDNEPPVVPESDIENLSTQVLFEKVEEEIILEKEIAKDVDIENLPTQVIHEDVLKNKSYNFNQFSEEIVISPFKIPSNSARKSKKKDAQKSPLTTATSGLCKSPSSKDYYVCTQDILEDLCTQRGSPVRTFELDTSIKVVGSSKSTPAKKTLFKKLDIIHTTHEGVSKLECDLSSQDVRDIIGVDNSVAKPVKSNSDGSTSSDLEVTPKKVRSIKVMDTVLPNSQEIKTNVSTKRLFYESPDSDTENYSEEQNTPIVHKKRKKTVPKEILNVTKKLEIEKLPTRVITRARKPTLKLKAEDIKSSFLKPKYLVEQEDIIEKEIITENITRLKNHMEKSKNGKICEESHNICNTDHEVAIPNAVKTDNITKPSKIQVRQDLVEKSQAQKRLKEEKRRSEPDNNKSGESGSKNDTVLTRVSNSTNKSGSTAKPKNRTRSSVKNNYKDYKNETIQFELKSPIRTRSRSSRITQNTSNPTKSNEESTKNNNPNLKSTVQTTNIKEQSTKITETSKETDKKSTVKQNQDKRKRTKKQDPQSPAKQTRRSRRQKTVKEDVKLKSILKSSKELEHSTVYNTSGSNSDSPRSLKRQLGEISLPNPKRTRPTSSRAMETQYVLFTVYPDAEVKGKLEKMGAVIVSDVMKCTVVLTQCIRRTFKLLCAVGLGKPIVGTDWVHACSRANAIVDPWQHIIKDGLAESKFQFSLRETLIGERNFLYGYNISTTALVKPEPAEMKCIVECSGGCWKEGGPNWLCVTSPMDHAQWPALQARGATLVTIELILGGVLRQKLEIDKNRMRMNYVK